MAKHNVITTGLLAITEMSGFELNILQGFIWHVYTMIRTSRLSIQIVGEELWLFLIP